MTKKSFQHSYPVLYVTYFTIPDIQDTPLEHQEEFQIQYYHLIIPSEANN